MSTIVKYYYYMQLWRRLIQVAGWLCPLQSSSSPSCCCTFSELGNFCGRFWQCCDTFHSDSLRWYWYVQLRIHRETFLQYPFVLDIQRRTFSSKWIYSCGPATKICNLSVQIIRLKFELWKIMMYLIREKKKPIPKLFRIFPRSVAQWNTEESGIDLMSRYLSHVKIPFKSVSPLQQYIVRILLMAVVNGTISTRALSNVQTKWQ